MGTKDLVKVICMSNGFAQLTSGYQIEYLVGKAVDAANLCALCADPLAVALKFAATFGNTINSMSPDAIAMHVDSISAALDGQAHQDLLTVIGTFPNIEEPKPGDPLYCGPLIQPKPAEKPTVAEDVKIAEEVKAPEVGLVASLAIPPKQKKAMAAAGLVTFEDVIKFHKEKTLESLPDIGEVSQGHILSLVGFKE